MIASEMKAKELQLWKEVDGIFSCDPVCAVRSSNRWIARFKLPICEKRFFFVCLWGPGSAVGDPIVTGT